MQDSCNTCSTNTKSKVANRSSFLSVLFVIILPKCPFCIMAYTSAITMCGGHDMYMATNNWVSYIPIALAVIINGLIIYNWKGSRTSFALFLSLTGLVFVSLAHQLILSSDFYNYGTAFLFVAIWFNSNLVSFINTIIEKLRNSIPVWQK